MSSSRFGIGLAEGMVSQIRIVPRVLAVVVADVERGPTMGIVGRSYGLPTEGLGKGVRLSKMTPQDPACVAAFVATDPAS